MDLKNQLRIFLKILSESQKKRKAVFLECLAVKEALKYWQYWLLGNHFTVFSDHTPLEHLRISTRTDEELGDMMQYLSQFDFDIIYKPGPENREADCLLRNPVLDSSCAVNKDIIYIVNFISKEEIINDQSSLQCKASDFIQNGFLCRNIRGKTKVVLSPPTAQKLIDRVHVNFGHIGSSGMTDLITPYIYSENLYGLIRKKARNCSTYIKNKSRKSVRLGLMGHFGPASNPLRSCRWTQLAVLEMSHQKRSIFIFLLTTSLDLHLLLTQKPKTPRISLH